MGNHEGIIIICVAQVDGFRNMGMMPIREERGQANNLRSDCVQLKQQSTV